MASQPWPLDLVEEFRPLIADSVCLALINNGEIGATHFISRGDAVGLTQDGRRKVIEANERRMDSTVTHPLFGYAASYRRLMEIQSTPPVPTSDGGNASI